MHSDPAPFSHWLHNGELCDAEATALSVTELSRFSGRGIFETIPLYRGRPLALEDHWMRVLEGGRRFDLVVPTLEQLHEQIVLLAAKNNLAAFPLVRARITILAPGGSSSATHHFLAVTSPPPHLTEARVITLPFRRNERSALVGIKTLNYGENEIALQHARSSGADEAIFQNTRDELCEGIWTNLFVRIDGRWQTPSLRSGCLPGVTRKLVLALGGEAGLPIEESDLPAESLDAIESAFLTSSLREIQPVTSIDERDLDRSHLHEIETLRRAFRDHVDRCLS